jgi:6-phosphogluconate dehydrogenase
MGANMVRRLLRRGHECVVFDLHDDAVRALTTEGAIGATALDDFVCKLPKPRTAWMMIPVATVDDTLDKLARLLETDDVVIDGGNTHYQDDLRRAADLRSYGIHYLDVGTSGGVWGLERGYCQMIGGDAPIVQRLEPIFAALAPDIDTTSTDENEAATDETARHGYLHCGPNGAGHFVKMVHNGIEYGFMAALAEGLNVLQHANVGRQQGEADAETTPLDHPEHYRYVFNLAEIVEVWRHGSVIRSWLLDLVAQALVESPDLANYAGRVSDSGEGRWTVMAAINESVPAPVISAALYARFSSRGEDDFAAKVLSALRYEFGGHVEKGTVAKE